jgi:tyrosine aminotransferase
MSDWPLNASAMSLRTTNPIRALVDQLKIEPNPDKSVIQLSLGDPTLFGNLPCPAILRDLVSDAVHSSACAAGYGPATGTLDARTAVAAHSNESGWSLASAPVSANDVVIASGCSHALQIAIHVLCDQVRKSIFLQIFLLLTHAHARSTHLAGYKCFTSSSWVLRLPDHL